MDEVLLKSERRSVRQSLTAYSEAKLVKKFLQSHIAAIEICQDLLKIYVKYLMIHKKQLYFTISVNYYQKKVKQNLTNLYHLKVTLVISIILSHNTGNIYYAVATKRQSTLRDTKIQHKGISVSF